MARVVREYEPRGLKRVVFAVFGADARAAFEAGVAKASE